MTAMTACGVGPLRVFRPLAFLTFVIAAFLAVLSYKIVPDAWLQSNRICASRRCVPRSSARSSPAGSAASPAATRSSTPSASTRVGELYGVFVQRTVGEKLEIAMAERAVQRGAGQRRADVRAVRRPPLRGRSGHSRPGASSSSRSTASPVRLPDLKKAKNKEELRSHAGIAGVEEPNEQGRTRMAHGGAGHGGRADGARGAVVQAATATGSLCARRPRRARLFPLLEPARGRACLDREGVARSGSSACGGCTSCRSCMAGWLLWREERPGLAVSPRARRGLTVGKLGLLHRAHRARLHVARDAGADRARRAVPFHRSAGRHRYGQLHVDAGACCSSR